jgi:hypothetical protein
MDLSSLLCSIGILLSPSFTFFSAEFLGNIFSYLLLVYHFIYLLRPLTLLLVMVCSNIILLHLLDHKHG